VGGQVLIVDDEEAFADACAEYLRAAGIRATAVGSAGEARLHLAAGPVSLVLLDVNLPGSSGFDLCRELRATSDCPIVFISARGGEDDEILALGIGGDDYLTKPFSLALLLAKVRRLLDRFASAGRGAAAGDLEGPLAMDPGNAFGAFTESFDLMRTELAAFREREDRLTREHRTVIAQLGHDLGTPAASISAAAELLEVDEDDPRRVARLRVIRTKALRIARPPLGRVLFAGSDLSGFTEDGLARFRRTHSGFVSLMKSKTGLPTAWATSYFSFFRP
jgi:DNA-binding response OmpR family regulator